MSFKNRILKRAMRHCQMTTYQHHHQKNWNQVSKMLLARSRSR